MDFARVTAHTPQDHYARQCYDQSLESECEWTTSEITSCSKVDQVGSLLAEYPHNHIFDFCASER